MKTFERKKLFHWREIHFFYKDVTFNIRIRIRIEFLNMENELKPAVLIYFQSNQKIILFLRCVDGDSRKMARAHEVRE